MVKKLLRSSLFPSLLILLGLVGYTFHLTKLPVFADEAIYIRWSQLIIDDWQRYLFFPLNDGKTPLFMWFMVPGQLWGQDSLFDARLVSVLSALVLIWLVGKIVPLLGGTRRTKLIAQLLTLILPFWFFSARLALIDVLLVAFTAASLWNVLRYFESKKWWHLALGGLWLGLAFWTKLPAILCIPLIAMVTFTKLFTEEKLAALEKKGVQKLVFAIGFASGVGVAFFALLKLNPAFGQLFSRGGDFLYPLNELNISRILFNLMAHTRDFNNIFMVYLTAGGMLLLLTSLLFPKHHTRIIGMWLAALAYCLPIILLGKVIHPRYLLPAALPLTLGIAFAIDNYIYYIQHTQQLGQKTLASLVLALLLAQLVSFSAAFWLYSWLSPNNLPLVKDDRVQYLSEWSAGNGLKDTADQIMVIAQNKRILVLTEGYFGTLPDGILMYLHGKNVTNIFVEGIGQPVRAIPQMQRENAQKYDVVWLVVNSHRLFLNPPPTTLVNRYCRLENDPCLEVWDITEYLKQ